VSKEKEARMKKYLMVVAMLSLLFFPGASWTAEVEQKQPLQPEPTLGSEFARGVIAPVLSLFYFPLKLAVGVSGAVLGGVSGWATGGDERAAEGVWRPMTGGTYFITPQVLDGEWPFLPFDGGPYTQSAEPAAPIEPMNR
jgi:hypothetical protein